MGVKLKKPEGVDVAHVVVAEKEALVLLLPLSLVLQQKILEDDEEDLHWALAVVDWFPVLDDAAPSHDLLHSP